MAPMRKVKKKQWYVTKTTDDRGVDTYTNSNTGETWVE